MSPRRAALQKVVRRRSNLLRPSDVAGKLGISASSVRNWTAEPSLQEFLSENATRKGRIERNARRGYTQDDLIVFNTVNNLKTRQTPWEEVAEKLRSGYRDAALPDEMLAGGERDGSALVDQFSTLTQRLEERDRARLREERLEEQVSELNRHIGRLQMQIEMLQEELKRRG